MGSGVTNARKFKIITCGRHAARGTAAPARTPPTPVVPASARGPLFAEERGGSGVEVQPLGLEQEAVALAGMDDRLDRGALRLQGVAHPLAADEAAGFR